MGGRKERGGLLPVWDHTRIGDRPAGAARDNGRTLRENVRLCPEYCEASHSPEAGTAGTWQSGGGRPCHGRSPVQGSAWNQSPVRCVGCSSEEEIA
ncbi:hypothetical protein GCM10010519_21790 [Streptomyces lactacystinicus]